MSQEAYPTPATVRIFEDGDKWCALLGPDLQEGIGGFGATPTAALRDLARRMDAEGWELEKPGPVLVKE
jgi:hypothetical protein